MEHKLEVGDIILVSGEGFLAKAIRFFMRIYRKKKYLEDRKVYNHVAVVINVWGRMWIAEAAAEGVRVIKYPDDYVRRQDCKVMGFMPPLGKEKQETFSKYACEYAFKVTRYDILNFWYQARYILTGKWKGPTGKKSLKRLYCSEFAAVMIDYMTRVYEGHTWDKNPLDIEMLDGDVLITKWIDPKRKKT